MKSNSFQKEWARVDFTYLIPIPQCLWGRIPEQQLFSKEDQKQMVNKRKDTTSAYACNTEKQREKK